MVAAGIRKEIALRRMIKECPFCGSDDVHLYVRRGTQKYPNFCYVECDLCGAKSKAFTYFFNQVTFDGSEEVALSFDDAGAKKAIDAWNRRTSEGGTDHGRQ